VRFDPRRLVPANPRLSIVVLTVAAIIRGGAPVYAWDSRTHELIARLAIDGLPQSSLRRTLADDEIQLQEDATAPDFALKREYGHAEAIRHYIDLEDYGPDPFGNLNPDINLMRQRYGEAALERSGTLPWTIEQVAAQVEQAWRKGDCRSAETLSGRLPGALHRRCQSAAPLNTLLRRYCRG
jgi:hypothetical protein